MKLDLICTRKFKYPSGSAGKEYAAGDHFKALSERDAKVLVAVGRAKENPGRTRNKTDIPAAPKAQETAAAPLDRGAGNYSTRVMTPEE